MQARLAEAYSIQGDAFNAGAINMAAAKVASASGDMRMCLKYCRRAIEVTGLDGGGGGGGMTSVVVGSIAVVVVVVVGVGVGMIMSSCAVGP